ncbi:hypothetical protein KM043_002927 [Ampulex compressa]|nr:hypothetical protein KM043_002927 [Ampulex compressa]
MEAAVMEGLRVYALGTKRQQKPSKPRHRKTRERVYRRIGMEANLNADRALNTADVRTHESNDVGTLEPRSSSTPHPPTPNATAGILIASFHPRYPALRVSLGRTSGSTLLFSPSRSNHVIVELLRA